MTDFGTSGPECSLPTSLRSFTTRYAPSVRRSACGCVRATDHSDLVVRQQTLMDIIARNTGVKPWATFAGETFWLQSRYLSQVGTLPLATLLLELSGKRSFDFSLVCSSGRGRRSVFPVRRRVRPLHGPLTGLPLLMDC